MVLVAVFGTKAEAGHEIPYYPSFYPQEIALSVAEPAAALRLFAETTYFRSLVGTGRAADAPADALPAGTSKDECDARVGELISVL